MKTALLIVDVQRGMFDPEFCVAGGEPWLERVVSLADRARARGVLVVFVQHCGKAGHGLEKGTDGWDFHPAVRPKEGDLVFEKSEPEAFHGTDIDGELRRRGVGRLVITGIATEYCVDSTVRGAYRLGYDVVLVEDAHTTWSNKELMAEQIVAHHNLTLRRFGEVIASDDLEF